MADQRITRRFAPRFLMGTWAIAVMLAVFSAVPASATTITVTNLNDSGAGSLRAAIASASSGDTINFSVAGTITLSSTLSINTSLTISGPGVSSLAISGNNSVQVFAIGSGITVTISGLTIQNGSAIVGGGIENAGTLTVTNCTFSSNSASAQGGGIRNESGTATVTNCTFSGNSASGQGGGINNAFGGTLTVTDSTFFGNTGFEGGAINTDEGPVTVINSTFSGNSTSQHGGAINNDDIGPVIVTNSTFSGNSAACSGCGGSVTAGASGATVILQNTIVANSPSGGNCAFTITDGGGNLSWPDTTCPGINVNPMLDPSGLQNNGGPTQTIALLAGSPAIGADVNANCPATDQRGVPRPSGQCDIGAYQLIPFLSSGSFVIGDLNAAVGNTVTFWGAQWAKANSLSGGSAPDAFKGFADQTSTAPPACGGSWTSDPGNSSKPPDSVPSLIPVIVSSSVTKSGRTISGDVFEIVIVQTNPGYGSSPGHAGTGTVVLVLCGP